MSRIIVCTTQKSRVMKKLTNRVASFSRNFIFDIKKKKTEQIPEILYLILKKTEQISHSKTWEI